MLMKNQLWKLFSVASIGDIVQKVDRRASNSRTNEKASL